MRETYFWRIKSIYPALKLIIRVGKGVSELNRVLLEDKVVTKGQSSVVLQLASLHCEFVREVLDVVGASFPVLVVNKRLAEWFHRVIVEGVLLVLYRAMSTKLIRLSRTVPRLRPLLTLKLNH